MAGGVVRGNITSSGIDLQADGLLNPCPATSYTFASTTLTGVFNITTFAPHSITAAGTLNITASGGSASECGHFAAGGVTVNACAGNLIAGVDVMPPNPVPAAVFIGGAANCGLAGNFVRVGSVVLVALGGNVCAQDRTHGGFLCGAINVVSTGLFIPDPTGVGPCPGDPTHQCVFRATFAGWFAGEGI